MKVWHIFRHSTHFLSARLRQVQVFSATNFFQPVFQSHTYCSCIHRPSSFCHGKHTKRRGFCTRGGKNFSSRTEQLSLSVSHTATERGSERAQPRES
ncbi:hypothetical protein VZT92_000742 [Zoarces viviparus]|uniref:Secreted protein n=1 Tax=Zoarces viviparus TaxID=48416 RepID=A0AAW1G8V9_ZOAVI